MNSLLLSTDLFDEGREPGPLRYVSFYDPHKNPCFNPLRAAVGAIEDPAGNGEA